MTSPVFQLCDDYVARFAALDPITATMRGIVGEFRAATDFSPQGYEARGDLVRETLTRLDELSPAGDADRLAADFLRERLGADLAIHDSGEHLRAVRAPFGLAQTLSDSVELLPRTNDDQWRAVAARLAAVPAMLGGWRESLSLGLDRGLPGARRQALEAATQADRLAGGSSADRLAGESSAAPTFAGLVEAYGDGSLRAELDEAATKAHTAYADTASYLRRDYAPRAAEADGVGAERYQVFGRLFLGTDVDPVEAYAWGWEELRRIEAEMAAEADRVRSGATVDEALAILNDSEFVTGADAYQGWLQDQHDRAIEALHGTHFDIAPSLRTVEVVLARSASSGAAYYTPPSEDLSRPGRTWWPLGGRDQFTTWDELTTVFHEGVPGHHLQLGQARVAGGRLSRFSRTWGVSGHGEGWALYAERLADELGWFTTPGQRLGMLMGSALRATRVVLDIGVHLDLPMPPDEARRHGPRWTFEVAKEVLLQRGRAAEHQVHPEVVRYFGWPAQAISYKLGERSWVAARAEAQQRLGAGFDLKRWHTAALSLGPVGLDGLADALRRV